MHLRMAHCMPLSHPLPPLTRTPPHPFLCCSYLAVAVAGPDTSQDGSLHVFGVNGTILAKVGASTCLLCVCGVCVCVCFAT